MGRVHPRSLHGGSKRTLFQHSQIVPTFLLGCKTCFLMSRSFFILFHILHNRFFQYASIFENRLAAPDEAFSITLSNSRVRAVLVIAHLPLFFRANTTLLTILWPCFSQSRTLDLFVCVTLPFYSWRMLVWRVASCSRVAAAHLVHTRAQDGRTALMWAAEKGHADCARALLDAGADKNAVGKVRATRFAAGRCSSFE